MAVDLTSPGARTLFEHWVHGKGALEIRWGTDGSMDRCIHHLTGKVRDPGGLCAEYHKAATGEWPAEKGIESAAETMEFGTRWVGLLAPVNAPTGDRRKFVPGALSHRPLPLPLMWQRMSVGGKHDGSVVIGTLDNIRIDDNTVIGEGDLFDPDTIGMPRLAEDINEVRFLLQKGVIGPSVDLDDVTFEMRNGEAVIVKGRISAATLLPVPAFAEARAFRIFENGVLVASCGVDEGLVLPFEFITLREWREAKHPRGFHGRFRETADAPRLSAPHPRRREESKGSPAGAHRAPETPRKRTTKSDKATSEGRHSKKEETAEDLNKLTVPQLRVLAKERGVYVPSRARKAEVIEKILADVKDVRTPRTPKKKNVTSAEQLTVVQLREIAKENKIYVPSRVRKADIIRHIQSWELGNSKKVLPGSSEVQDVPEKVSEKVVTGRPFSWVRILDEDTGFDFVRIRDLEVPTSSGYVIKSGRAYRIDGITYLIEDGAWGRKSYGGQITHELIVRELQKIHRSLPKGADAYQRGYAWLAGTNPADKEWSRRYQIAGFRSLATAGDGGVRIWDRKGAVKTPKWHRETLIHEFGHNVSHKSSSHPSGIDLSDSGSAWRNAYKEDAKVKRPTAIEFNETVTFETHGISLESDSSRLFPEGVSSYGKSSVGEDYAESMMFYEMGPVGWGRLTPSGPLEQIYFRDLFPHRAAILDRIFPEIARAQKARKRVLRSQP